MKQLKQVGLPVASILLMCVFPCVFMFSQNAGEARAVDMLPFFGIFLLTAAGIFLLADIFLRNVARSAVLADLGVLAVINFTMICNGIKRLIPGFHNIIFLVLVGAVLLGLFILFLRKKPNMVIPCGLLTLMFGILTLMNLFLAMPTLISAATYERPQAPLDSQLDAMQIDGEKRNVYYMIFDEYGGPEGLKRYYDCDNEEFLQALEERGFSASRTSRNRESCWTVTLVPNLLNMDYVTDDTIPINNRLEWLEEPVLYRLFRQNGYQVNLINHNGFLKEKGCRPLSRPQYDETISDYLYKNSIFCQIPKLKGVIERRVLHWGENGPMESLEDVSQALKDSWMEAQDGPTLTVSYMASPHAPFLFDMEGRPTPPEAHFDRKNLELYLAKLYYTNELILETVDNIQKNDPTAVILLQADHGARLPGHLVNEYGGPWFDAGVEIPYMQNVLCCALVPGEELSVEGESCINATRKALSAAFGLELPPLAEPEDYTIPPEYMPPPPEQASPGEETSGTEPPEQGRPERPPHRGGPPREDPPHQEPPREYSAPRPPKENGHE